MSLSVQYSHHIHFSNLSRTMNFLSRFSLLTIVSLMVLSACSQPKSEIEVIDPWLRLMPEGVSSTAGFMTIKNNTDTSIVLEDVSLDWANHA